MAKQEETKKVVKKAVSKKAVKVASPKAKAVKKVVAKKAVVKTPKAVKPKASIVSKTASVASDSSKESCKDKNCVHCGGLRARGRVFEGTVVSDKMQGTVTVQWPRQRYIPKYERYYKTKSKVKAHNSPCVAAKTGDKVRIAECRPISKTVNFVIMEVLEG